MKNIGLSEKEILSELSSANSIDDLKNAIVQAIIKNNKEIAKVIPEDSLAKALDDYKRKGGRF